MSRKDDRPRRKPISIINWMLTLLVAGIPGVNIIAFVLMMIFSRNRSKKSFAAAALILMLLLTLVIVVLFLVMGDRIVDLTRQLYEYAETIEMQ